MKLVFIGNDSDAADMAELGMRIRWPDTKLLMTITAREGLELVGETSPDVILLHTSFSDMSLEEAIQGLRQFPYTPLLVLSDTDNEMEVVIALEMGADDYLRVPFDISVLMARAWALLRRVQDDANHEIENVIRSGSLLLSPATHELFLSDCPVYLTSAEFRVLYTLVKNHGSVATHRMLERMIWGDQAGRSSLLKKYIQRLMQKIGDTADDPTWISSVQSVGYRFIGPKPEFLETRDPALSLAG